MSPPPSTWGPGEGDYIPLPFACTSEAKWRGQAPTPLAKHPRSIPERPRSVLEGAKGERRGRYPSPVSGGDGVLCPQVRTAARVPCRISRPRRAWRHNLSMKDFNLRRDVSSTRAAGTYRRRASSPPAAH